MHVRLLRGVGVLLLVAVIVFVVWMLLLYGTLDPWSGPVWILDGRPEAPAEIGWCSSYSNSGRSKLPQYTPTIWKTSQKPWTSPLTWKSRLPFAPRVAKRIESAAEQAHRERPVIG